MNKFDKYFNASTTLVLSLILILFGIILIILNKSFYFLIVDIFIYIILLIGIKNFIGYFTNKNNNKTFFRSLLNLIFALVLSLFKAIPQSFLPIIMGIYFLINFIIQVIDFIIILQNNDKGKFSSLFVSIFYLILAICLIGFPLKNIKIFLICLGIYFIIMGLHFIIEFLNIVVSEKNKNKFKSKIRFTLPVFLECFIPYSILNEINELLKIDSKNLKYEIKKNNEDPDIEILVHVSNNGFNRLGHTDLCINNKVVSYGNYDRSSASFRELFGSGVVFFTNKDKYINFCIEHSKKTLFVFGLKLNEKQKLKIKNEIDKLKGDLYRWYPPIEVAKTKNKKISKKRFNDYASILYSGTNAEFYKLKRGKYKTYFVLGNNCCSLVNRIIGKSGINLLRMNGIITPGTYYEYLNKEFMKKNSIVISKNIYNDKRKREIDERD